MHKDIAEQIKLVVEKHEHLKDCKVFVQSQDTEGFWGLMILFPANKKHFVSHIKSVAEAVGRLYGEHLMFCRFTEKEGMEEAKDTVLHIN